MTDINQLYADLDSQHIEGIAREGNVAFNVPLISHVEGNLWQGGCIGGVRLPDDFDYVISLYPWQRYSLGRETQRFEFTLYDVGVMPDIEILGHIASLAKMCQGKGKTLVHCQAGLNRSALVSGLSLILSGRDPDEVINLLRQRRSPAVLCNKTFESFLRSIHD